MYIDERLLKFILKYHGRLIDFDSRYGAQCTDLWRQYVKEVLGFIQPPGVVCAREILDSYQPQFYTRIYNGPDNFPIPGDIIVWSGNYNGGCGHVGICLYASSNRIVSFDQNDPVNTPCHIQHHSYFSVAGWLRPKTVSDPVYATLPEGHALKGLHGVADPRIEAWNQFDLIDVVRECSFESVKVLCPGTSAQQVQTMRDKGARFIYARLFAHMGEPRGDTLELRARWFVGEVYDDLFYLYTNGNVRYVEIHNEPNLVIEGLGSNWVNGVEFGVWFNYVAAILKERLPQIKCGFPGLSPGPTIYDPENPRNNRQDSTVFFAQAQQAVTQSDFLCQHTYFGGDGSQWQIMIEQINTFADAHKNKVILVSEFSNNAQLEVASKEIKGQQYRAFYAAGKSQLKPNVGALNVFVLWSSGAFQHETLVEKDGTRSAIVSVLS